MAEAGPVAATAAYLARIPPAVAEAAARHAAAGVVAWALGLIGPLAVVILLVRSGAVARAWRWGGRRGGLAAGLAVVALLAAASSGWNAFVQWATAGSAPSLGGLCAGVIGRAVLFALAWAMLKAAGPRPRLVLGALAVAMSFLLVFGPEAAGELMGPRLDPAPAAVAEAARDVARASGVAVSEVVLSASAPGEGDVSGLFRRPRILLRPEAARAPLAEVRAGVGHVLGHYRARDGLGWALWLAALGVGGVLAVVGMHGVVDLGPSPGRGRTGPVAEQREDGVTDAGRGSAASSAGAERDESRRSVTPSSQPPSAAGAYPSPSRGRIPLADPRALPVLWALTAAWVGLAQPAAFAWDQAVNLRADRFSLAHAREPDGLAMKLVRENGLEPADPPLIERLIVCSHPPLQARLDQAMRWKADQRR